MKTALISELMIWKDSIVRVSVLYAVIGVFIGVATENPWTTTAMVACMFAIGSALSGPLVDEKNGWEVGRLCLPVSRRDIVLSRYIATTLFTAFGIVLGLVATAGSIFVAQTFFPGNNIVNLVADGDVIPASIFAAMFAALVVAVSSGATYPLSFALGNKKALRWVPVVVCLLVVFAVIVIDSDLGSLVGLAPALEEMFASSVVPGIVAIGILYVIVMAISCVISIKVYERREL